MATFGSFPGVRVNTESGNVASVAIGAEEKLVLFGESDYAYDSGNIIVEGDDPSLNISASEPEQIPAPRVAETKFGSDSELADGMLEALQNGGNIDFLYGVAVPREYVEGESQGSLDGSLDNVAIVENTGDAVDSAAGSLNDQGIEALGDFGTNDNTLDVELRYNGNPPQPSSDDTVFVNPLTGEYSASSNVVTPIGFDYTYNDYATAFGASPVRNVVNEGETGVFFALSESDSVSSDLDTEVSSLRTDYQLVTGFTLAEPNDNKTLDEANTSNENGGARARYDTANYDTANQSVTANYFYKFAPSRIEKESATIGGGLAGLFAGNDISNPVYNDAVSGYNTLQQQLSKSEADELRSENINPIRSGGAVRVKGNRSTAYDSGDPADTFWYRRITDRVILIGKQVGDDIIGQINNPETRADAARVIRNQMRSLENDGLIKTNAGEENNWTVNVYEANSNEVKIDIAFTPYGVVKQVDETITISTN